MNPRNFDGRAGPPVGDGDDLARHRTPRESSSLTDQYAAAPPALPVDQRACSSEPSLRNRHPDATAAVTQPDCSTLHTTAVRSPSRLLWSNRCSGFMRRRTDHESRTARGEGAIAELAMRSRWEAGGITLWTNEYRRTTDN